MIEQIQDLRDDDKTSTEIAAELGLDINAVMRVPARGSKGDRSIRGDDEDQYEDEIYDNEEEDDE